MTMAASAPGKWFRAPVLSAEKPDFRLRPCVQSAAWTSVSCFAVRKRFLDLALSAEKPDFAGPPTLSPRPGAELAPAKQETRHLSVKGDSGP